MIIRSRMNFLETNIGRFGGLLNCGCCEGVGGVERRVCIYCYAFGIFNF